MRRMKNRRKGAIALFLCICMVPLAALFAFSVDYGFLLFIRTDLQGAADNAALAAVRDLLPDEDGNQDLDKVRETVREYVRENLGSGFEVRDEDIEIGRFNPSKIYTSVELLDSGIQDAVRVTIRRSELANTSVFLFFARIFDRSKSDVVASATAVLQKGRYIGPGTDILPLAISRQAWNKVEMGDTFTVYGDGSLTSWSGASIPGNWGTVDIGSNSNSTADIKDQILNGVRQSDLDSLARSGTISTSEYIDSQETFEPNGDTGFSAGMKNAIDTEVGNAKLIPIYQSTSGKGGNLSFKIIGWGVVKIDSTKWNGNSKSYVRVTRGYMYDKDILPNPDLSDTNNIMEAVYTSPALVE